MTRCRCIVAAIDLGHDTEKIVSYAEYFAERTETPVKLLHVVDYLLTPPAYISTYIEDEKKHYEVELAKWNNILSSRNISNEYRLLTGRLHESFLKVLDESAPAMLVIGYRSHIIRPSSSERLIKSIQVPMLVVRGEKSEGAKVGSVRINRILCPVDFSENSEKAISIAKLYAGRFSASLDLLHIIPSHLLKERLGKCSKEDRHKLDLEIYSDARSRLAALINKFSLETAGEILEGEPSEKICSVAFKSNYDLIVIGARGLSYIQGILIGSTTEAVLRSSPCPVLIIH